MHIVIDGNEANIVQRVGSNVYAFELLAALEKITRDRVDVKFTVVLSAQPIPDLPPVRKGWQYQAIRPTKFWTQWALPWYLYQNRAQIEVFFTPGHYAPRITPVPYVSSVMDVAYHYFPQQFRFSDYLQLSMWTKFSVKQAAKIIAISQSTLRDVVKVYRRKAEDIAVAYPAVVGNQRPVSPIKAQAIIRKFKVKVPYFLYVGTLQPRKNLVNLISAYEVYRDQVQTAGIKSAPKQLVLAGKIGWLADAILAQAEKSRYKDEIIFTGFISDSEKKALYSVATASILVGIYEGFGMPPLESLALGTIPVVANSSSLPEVVGDAGILVEPLDPAKIADGLMQAATLKLSQKQEWKSKAAKQVARFSWEKSAQVVLDTLLEVAR